MSLTKQYNEKKPVCKVTFKLEKNMASSAHKVYLTGDFNNWDVESTPMKRLKGGDFTVTLDLEKGREYQFKYLTDNDKWLNETHADKYVINEFQGENSVIIV